MNKIISEEDAEATVEAAWKAGIRYFDTAPLYGHGLSELRLGRALASKPRDSFVLSTKVGRLLEPCSGGDEASGIYLNTPQLRVAFDYSYDGVMRSVEASLTRLRSDRLDALFVHDVDSATHGSKLSAEARLGELVDQGGWRALERRRQEGIATAIGVGVNECWPCEWLLDRADPDLFLLAGRYTLLDRSAAERLLPRCLERSVGVVLGGPFNSGILATGPIPGARYDYAPAPRAVLEKARKLEEICERQDVTLARAALHFPYQHPAIVSVLAGSQTTIEVMRNVADFYNPPPLELWTHLN